MSCTKLTKFVIIDLISLLFIWSNLSLIFASYKIVFTLWQLFDFSFSSFFHQIGFNHTGIRLLTINNNNNTSRVLKWLHLMTWERTRTSWDNQWINHHWWIGSFKSWSQSYQSLCVNALLIHFWSLAIPYYTHFLFFLQTLKLNIKNRKMR